jgi:MinD superfamily P-loop ATPase
LGFRIAIASGKGGTGKTTVAVSLFHFLNRGNHGPVILVDCDVEEPNDLIFFPEAVPEKEQQVFRPVPVISNRSCTWCRKCVEYCAFNAIVVIPPASFAEVNASLCHSCGACLVACEENAIHEQEESLGEIAFHRLYREGLLAEGRLRIGSAMQTMLIRELKKRIPSTQGVTLFDAPPGTSCPVVETISDTDYVVLVTEPTPFGLHDLRLMVDLLQEVRLPFGVVINKAGLGDRAVYHYLREQGAEILGEIPFSREYASAYAQGELFRRIPGAIAGSWEGIAAALEQKILIHEGDHRTQR